MSKEAKCTLTDEELIIRAEKWVHKLAQSGGKDWCLRVPVDLNHDPDMLFMELCSRLKSRAATPSNDEEKEQEAWPEVVYQVKNYLYNGQPESGLMKELKQSFIIKRRNQ